jgi:hypothetical protein
MDTQGKIIEILHDNAKRQLDDMRDLRGEQEELKATFADHDKRAEVRHLEICSRLDKYNQELEVHIDGVRTAQKRLDAFEVITSQLHTDKIASEAISANNMKTLKLAASIITVAATIVTTVWQVFF